MQRKSSQESFDEHQVSPATNSSASSSLRRPPQERLLRISGAQPSPVGAKLHLRSNSSGSASLLGGASSSSFASNAPSPAPGTTLRDILQNERSFASASRATSLVSSPFVSSDPSITRAGHGRGGSIGSGLTHFMSNCRSLVYYGISYLRLWKLAPMPQVVRHRMFANFWRM